MSATVYFIFLLFSIPLITNASHFRGAMFSWTPSEDGSTIKIKFRISWRRNYTGNWCDDTVISTGSLIGSGSMTCYSGCNGTVGSLNYQCTDYSTDDNWSSGRNEVIYRVPAKSFSFRFKGCCWIDTSTVGAGGDWSVLATVDLSVRSDTGRINSSPTVEMTPVLNLQDGCPYKIFLQVGDVDGDFIRCRWAKGDIECLDVCNGLIGAVLDEEACSISFNPNGNQGLYAAALQIEDFASTGSTTPLSSVPLQFIVKVHNGSSCDDIPEFIQPTPEDSSCFALDVGDDMNVTLKARGSNILNRITTISAIGMVRSSEKKWQDSTWHYIETNVTWTPTEDDGGQDHTLCFYATDSTGVTSQIRCINLPVSVSGPTPLRVERVGFTNIWTIIFDQTFTRPTEATYIKVYESFTNTELLSVDASTSSDVVFDPINRRVNVSFHYDFDIKEDYYVTIPSGLVEGFVSCRALSVAVNDSSFWNIEVDCGKPAILNGDVITPNGTDYPHSVFYVCNRGHYLVGVRKRTCTANGTWTENDPFCNVKDCGYFSIPDNGFVSTNSTIYNTTVDFYCDEGFEISGNASMYCEHTAVWSTSPPVCILVDCRNPGYLDNGDVSTPNGTAYGMTAYYSCHLGYDLIGVSDRKCQQDKQWSGTIPFCSPKDCGPLSNPANGSVSAAATVYGSIAAYSCKSGFDMIGGSSITCQTNGSWSGEPPTCQIKDCGPLPPLANGYVYQPLTTYGSYALYLCDEGYHIEGITNIRRCMSDGNWSNDEHICTFTDCGNLTAPMFGDVIYNSTFYNDVAIFKCNPGYELLGDSVVTCQVDNTWSDHDHICVFKVCGFLQAPTNGLVKTVAEAYQTVATFMCNEGFDLVGDDTLVCTADGVWNGSVASCIIKDCGPLSSPDNGAILMNKTTFSSHVFYICDKGFELIGVDNRICLSNGTWSESAPACKLKDCGNLTVPYNGQVDVNDTTYGSTAIFSCNLGYSLQGHSITTCTETGMWDSDYQRCVLTDCGNLISPDDGSVSYSTTTYLSTAFYSCNIGYTLVGMNVTECTTAGTWSSAMPACQIVDCGPLLVPKHGNISSTVTTFGQKVNFICATGYDLIGDSQRTCLGTGVWSGTETICKIKDCGSLAAPDSGTIEITNTSYLSRVSYKCNIGYDLEGVSTRYCLENGSWSHSAPFCLITDCGNLRSPDYGNVLYSTTTYLSTAIYSCNIGYTLVGLNVTECTSAGIWSSTIPTCQIVDCGPLLVPTNGNISSTVTTFGQKVNFTCATGYDLIGDSQRTCLVTGVWSGTETICKIKDCGTLAAPDSGTIEIMNTSYLSKVSYKCNIGYDLEGVSTRYCLENGSWSHSAPSCLITDCGNLTSPDDGNVLYSTTTYLSTAIYSCNTGYTLVGMNVTECTSAGIWSSAIPNCQIVDCGPLHVPTHGNISSTVTAFGQKVNYTCAIGYDLIGDSQRTCLVTGVWSGTGTICKIKDCGTLAAPDSGTIEIMNTSYLSSVSYKCNIGYDLEGVSTRYCLENGSWSHLAPLCLITDCGNLTSPDDGSVLYSTTTYLSAAIYSCNIGYTLVGMNVTECTSAGIWSSAIPNCQIVDCGPLHVPTHGNISSTVTAFGQKVNLTCDIGYNLIGGSQRTCLVTGVWSGTGTICKIKDCGSLAAPDDGIIEITNTSYLSRVSYKCNIGYDLAGVSTRYCLENGSWSHSAPSCLVTDCGMLSDIEKGSINIPFTTYGSVASYICDRGYHVVGDVTRVCKADGNWDGADPSCDLIVCPEMPAPVNGHVEHNSTLFESEITYSCNPGYSLFGEAVVVCQKDGTWSGYGQNCTIKDCGDPLSPVNGDVHAKETVYRAEATYVCHTGFELVGSKTVTCREDELWSETGQYCTLKDCGIPSPPSNGNISYENTTYGSVARYFCFTGYDIKGEELVTCGADGFWSSTGQDCIIKGSIAVMIYGIIGGVLGFLVLVIVSIVITKVVLRCRRKKPLQQETPINMSTLLQY